MENECFGCGCSDSNSCDETCGWVVLESELGLGVCTNCHKHIDAFNKHVSELAKLAKEN